MLDADDALGPPPGALPGMEPATPAPADAKPKKRTRKRTPAADRAPRTVERNKGGRPTKAVADDKELQRQLADAFGTLGFAVMAFAQSPAVEADGSAIIERSEKLAESLVALARQNDAVRRFLTSGIPGSAWLGVAGAFGGLGLAIARNHGALADAPELAAVIGADFGGNASGLPGDLGAAMAAMGDMDDAELATLGKLAAKMGGPGSGPPDAEG
jgi:hypothetical protein